MIAVYMLFLTAGVRFLHYALYGEPLLSAQFFLVAYVWNLIVAGLGLSGDAGASRWRRSTPGLTSAPGSIGAPGAGPDKPDARARPATFFKMTLSRKRESIAA